MKIAYVSLHRFSTYTEKVLAQLSELTVFGVWIPKSFFIPIMSKIDITSIKKILARKIRNDNLHYNFRSSMLLEIVCRQRSLTKETQLSKISTLFEKLFKIKIKILLNRNDYIIIPADIWDLVSTKKRRKVILEIRWLTQDMIDKLSIPKSSLYLSEKVKATKIPIMSTDSFENFAGFITYSNVAKNSIMLSGASAEKILVAPLIENDSLIITNEIVVKNHKRLLYVGRSKMDKRLDLAVEISKKLSLPLDVVGKYDDDTKNWLILQNGVNFLGSIPHDELTALMKSDSILLAPGAESWGLAVFEALQAGMQVFASKFIGITEWINHPNLHVIEEMNTDLFVKTINSTPISYEKEKIFIDIDLETKWESFLNCIKN